MSHTQKTTKYKFYKKWDYKVSLYGKNMSYLRYLPVQRLPHNLINNNVIQKLSDFLSELDASCYFKRIESNTLDIYVNDKDLYETVCTKFSDHVRLTSAPAPGVTLCDGTTVRSNKLPYDRYRYKVFLKPHKVIDIQEKIRYLDWLETQEPRVYVSDNVKDWFRKTIYNWDRRYMYVEDDATLLMLKIKNPDAIGTVYNYQIADK